MVLPLPYHYHGHGYTNPLTALTVGILSSLPFVNKQRTYGVDPYKSRRHHDHYDRQHHIDVDNFKLKVRGTEIKGL